MFQITYATDAPPNFAKPRLLHLYVRIARNHHRDLKRRWLETLLPQRFLPCHLPESALYLLN